MRRLGVGRRRARFRQRRACPRRQAPRRQLLLGEAGAAGADQQPAQRPDREDRRHLPLRRRDPAGDRQTRRARRRRDGAAEQSRDQDGDGRGQRHHCARPSLARHPPLPALHESEGATPARLSEAGDEAAAVAGGSLAIVVEAFSAFGLSCSAGFPLPAAAAADLGLPQLTLELESTAGLEQRWSGAAAPGAWRGRLGDGEELAIVRGRAGDYRFSYSAGADFHLDPEAGRLGCAPSGAPPLAWRRVLLTRVLPNAAIAAGYEALHAAAVETGAGVVAIAAASGGG